MRGRRGGVTAAAMTAVLAGGLATGCTSAATAGDDGDGAPPTASAASTRSARVVESLAPDGTTVRVGSPEAKTVVRLYEDLRCPVCRSFETGGGGTALRGMIRSGEVRVDYTLASFLDARLGGHGSEKAANALRAALEAGKFAEYHDVLYAHQPEESVDGFTDAYLLEMAAKVKGLRGQEFDAAVKGMKYRDFVTASAQAYDASGVPGTPTMTVNGKPVNVLAEGASEGDMLPMLIRLAAAA
ncbi:DsbA family protein [Streptomyces sp. NPDC004690]